jgi:very-short-patch-repair endonuclease
MPALAAVDVLRRLGGSARWADLDGHLTRRDLAAAVRRGEVVRIDRGCYALASLPPARQAAALARGVLSHATAVEHWGWSTVAPPTQVHVSVAAGSKPKPIDGVRHHWRTLAPQDVVDGVTSPLRTVLDCAAVMPFREALTVADSALRDNGVLADELLTGAAVLRGPFSAGPRRVARLATGLAANPFESVLRAELLDAGLTGFTPQLVIRTPTSTARVDLGDERRRIAVEGDSYTHHGTRTAFSADCARYDQLVRAGWLVLRFTWEQVMFRPEWVVDVTRDVVRSRPPRRRR